MNKYTYQDYLNIHENKVLNAIKYAQNGGSFNHLWDYGKSEIIRELNRLGIDPAKIFR